MTEKNNILDEEAERLFQELGGIDKTKASHKDRLADGLLAKEKELDILRALLLEMTQLLGDFLKDARLLQNARIPSDPFIRFLEILSLLSKKSHQDKNIFIGNLSFGEKPGQHAVAPAAFESGRSRPRPTEEGERYRHSR